MWVPKVKSEMKKMDKHFRDKRFEKLIQKFLNHSGVHRRLALQGKKTAKWSSLGTASRSVALVQSDPAPLQEVAPN